MSLRSQIEEKYITSIKLKNTDEINTLRLIKSAIKYKDIENRTGNNKGEINDQKIIGLLQHLIKQRRDSIESFKLANRNDLIEREIKDASNYDAHGVEEDIENDLDDGEIEGVIHILNEDGDPIMTDLKPIIIANWEVKEEEEECY